MVKLSKHKAEEENQKRLFLNNLVNNYYAFYELNEAEQKLLLNKWFYMTDLFNSKGSTSKIIFKECDENTSMRLYLYKYNPIIITHIPHIPHYSGTNNLIQNESKSSVRINSIDDGCFGIFTHYGDYMDLNKEIKIIDFINEKNIINGDELMDFCVSIGFDSNEIHYD